MCCCALDAARPEQAVDGGVQGVREVVTSQLLLLVAFTDGSEREDLGGISHVNQGSGF